MTPAHRRWNRADGQIILAVGQPNEGRCGVHEYTIRLNEELLKVGARSKVDLLRGGRPDSFNWRDKDSQPCVWHHQYPSIGEGRQFIRSHWPAPRRAMRILTLHEYSQAHPLRRLHATRLSLGADKLIATTEAESLAIARATRCAPVVVPIGSALSPASVTDYVKPTRRAKSIVFFGLLAPSKGLEAFIETASVLVAKHGWRAAIIGTAAQDFNQYVSKIREESSPHLVWKLNVSDAELADELGSAQVGYFPYPDGVSERRSTLIAALEFGIDIVTTRGAATTSSLEELVTFAATPTEAVEICVSGRFIRGPNEEHRKRFLQNRQWRHIALEHLRVYEAAVGRRSAPGVPA